MLRLHLLGFTRDLKGLVFSGKRGGKTGTYWVEVDETFARAVQQLERARRKPGRAVPEPAAPEPARKGKKTVMDTQDLPLPRERPAARGKLTPREIQRLLREGRAVKDVAAKAGVDEAWVERFLGPVLEERAGVIRLTQQAHQRRSRLGVSGVPIGAAVRLNLQDKRANERTLEQLSDGWEARRMASGVWRVRLRFSHRGKRRSADWELRKDTGDVRPRNALAIDLGWRPPPPEKPKPEARRETAADDAEASQPTGEPRREAGRRASSARGARRSTAKRSTGKPAARRTTRKRPAAKRPAPRRRR